MEQKDKERPPNLKWEDVSYCAVKLVTRASSSAFVCAAFLYS